MTLLNWILTGVNILGALSGWAFMIIYTRRSKWWGTEHRAHLGWTTLALTAIMTLYVFRPFMNPVTFAYVRAPLFLAVVVCMVWRLTLLLRSQRPDQVRTDHEDAVRDVH
jgi:apolipoprotein N-acyltransferase